MTLLDSRNLDQDQDLDPDPDHEGTSPGAAGSRFDPALL